MSTSLSLLREQRRTVLLGMNNARNEISVLQDKVSRLQEASNTLETNITHLRTTKKSIDQLEKDGRRWRGNNKDTYDNKYSLYRDSIQQYLSKSMDAKETIDSDIRRYEANQASYAAGLNNLQSSLHSLESQIRAKERE
ncbi:MULTISPECIES: YwqH-like family protein [Virgibacillus]|uniref:Uncharacterized protein n=1 Tax=Virgibacillus dokdonensis TaxID=302167 RepID=A0A2K9J4N0_9BACI|nr:MULTISPECIES: DUF5082 family protein [Virgibacillus]AUJ26912.1 hypothetical protein A21D_03878 [Virgibacillus dokdonensis]NWO13239.1 DUF5082 family protein [Virgibacillus sp.]